MKIQQVTYTKRKNVGNYEHEEVSLVAVIEEDENVMESIARVKLTCNDALNMTVTHKVVEPVKEEIKEEAKDDKPKKKAKVTKKTRSKKTKPVVESDTGAEGETTAKPEKKVEASEDLEVVTVDQVKQALAQVWREKGKGIAKKILLDNGVERTDQLDPKLYSKVLKEAQCTL